MAAGVYIHIPFCVRKCVYCDFLSFETENYKIYVDALLDEIKTARFNEIFAGGVDTVYIGGGTPTALPSLFLCEILTVVHEFLLLPNVEITVEINPGTVDFAYLSSLKEHGVTRLSFGLQATQEHLLRGLGRIHSLEEFKKNFHAAKKADFDNINVDLMFALPGQTLQNWHETLLEVVSLAPQHISAYSLTPAENTPLFNAIKSGEIVLPCNDTDRLMYHEARRFLADAGYVHYEISNFAKRGFESRHNINCWQMKPYIGFGLGAHSFDGKTRWHNPEEMEEYLRGVRSGVGGAPLTDEDILSEKIILGLRLTEGVIECEFAGAYENEIAKLIKDGLLERKQNRLCLTARGMDFANRVFSTLL
ncbi:MAG: radical SAM family heme chaperone HemW [Defluviitaleaceae bacterium]|nr:radical SAM family heme chaperone HemW [Defluviitaleaceae bacterium]